MNISGKLFGSQQLYVDSSDDSQDEVKKSKMHNGTLYAGEKIFSLRDFIGEKKAQANRQAMKQIFEKFASDSKLDSSMEQMKDKQNELQKTIQATQEQLCKLEGKAEQFTPEEYDQMKTYFQKQAESAFAGYEQEGKAIASIRVERLKSHGMVDAQKVENQIREDTATELENIYFEDGIEQIDQKLDQAEEAIEQAEKEREEQERADEKKSQTEESMKGTTDSSTSEVIPDSYQEVRKFIKTERVLKEDYLGLLIDKDF